MGGMPPRPPGPPGGVGGVMAPSPMGGSTASAMTGVKVGVEALQKALPALPMGSELHTAILKAIESISKHIDQGMGGGAGSQIQQLIAMARDAQTQPQRSAMMSMFPPPGGGGPGGPPPGGGGPPPGGPPGMPA